MKVLGLAILTFAFVACVRAPIKSPQEALRPAGSGVAKTLKDDLDMMGLSGAMEVTILRLRENPSLKMRFGDLEVLQGQYATLLEEVRPSMDVPDQGATFREALLRNFELQEVYGTEDGWGTVFVTSYYSPVLQGSRKKTGRFQSRVLGKPKDLVRIPVGEFVKIIPDLESTALITALRDGVLRGKVVDGGFGREVQPYYSRKELRELPVGKVPSQTICYLDPVDHFFLQIQGSGTIELPNKKRLYLNYAEQNGHPYFPIGKQLLSVISLEEMSLQKIREHLRNLPLDQQFELMDMNSSYVFFEASNRPALTSFGVEAQAGRTIATDSRYLPKGALAFLTYPLPENATSGGAQKSSRFVLDHDTGGAIRGPGRVDLYWGEGALAEEVSGRMRGEGELYYFVPRSDALRRLENSTQK